MNKIIIINGSGGSGKSTFISMCKEINNTVIELSTVDIVKDLAKIIGWDGEKDDKGRKFLSELKKILEEYNDIPNKSVEEIINQENNKIFFINVREPKNIKYFVNKYNAITVLVRNENVKKIITNNSDANVEEYNYDYIIENNGTKKELKKAAQTFLYDINII